MRRTKTELYKQRCQDPKHQIQMYVANDFLKRNHPTKDAYTTLKSICREFNFIADGWTKTNEYSVPLNLPILNMAADFYYQYKQLAKWAEYKGCTDDFNYEIDPSIHQLFKAITLKAPQNMIAMEKDKLLSVLPQINKGSAIAVLLYMKARCSRHNQQGGITELKAETIAKGLGINRATVTRARTVLEENGLIEVIYKNKLADGGNIAVVTKYQVNI